MRYRAGNRYRACAEMQVLILNRRLNVARFILIIQLDGNLILPIKPTTKIDQLASLAAEGERGSCRGVGGFFNGLFANGTTHGRQVNGASSKWSIQFAVPCVDHVQFQPIISLSSSTWPPTWLRPSRPASIRPSAWTQRRRAWLRPKTSRPKTSRRKIFPPMIS